MPEITEQAEITVTSERERLLKLIVEALHRTIVHYGIWWNEVEHQLGREECIATEHDVWKHWYGLQMNRLGKVLGFEVEDGIPTAIKNMSEAELKSIVSALSVNWLAQDGIWFQAVENKRDLPTAQRCNDTAWGRFSPFTAHSIKATLNLPDDGGLDALEQALHHRLYAQINKYSIERPNADRLILRMDDCRVQSARKRKGLADYPCVSGGTVEYTSFARAIDSRIETRCLGCPPGPHPEEWFCAWEFALR